MPSQTVFEQIAVDALTRNGSLTGSDDHLAIRRRDTSCGIETGHSCS